MAPGLAEMFSAAVKQLVKKEGRGGQNGLADRLGIKKAHLSNTLAGRTGWPDHLKERVAHVYGYSVAELLLLGEQYLQSGVWFPHARAVLDTAPASIDRLERIVRLAAEDVGLGLSNVLFTRATIPLMFPIIVSDYESSRISDAVAYDHVMGPDGKDMSCEKAYLKKNPFC